MSSRKKAASVSMLLRKSQSGYSADPTCRKKVWDKVEIDEQSELDLKSATSDEGLSLADKKLYLEAKRLIPTALYPTVNGKSYEIGGAKRGVNYSCVIRLRNVYIGDGGFSMNNFGASMLEVCIPANVYQILDDFVQSYHKQLVTVTTDYHHQVEIPDCTVADDIHSGGQGVKKSGVYALTVPFNEVCVWFGKMLPPTKKKSKTAKGPVNLAVGGLKPISMKELNEEVLLRAGNEKMLLNVDLLFSAFRNSINGEKFLPRFKIIGVYSDTILNKRKAQQIKASKASATPSRTKRPASSTKTSRAKASKAKKHKANGNASSKSKKATVEPVSKDNDANDLGDLSLIPPIPHSSDAEPSQQGDGGDQEDIFGDED